MKMNIGGEQLVMDLWNCPMLNSLSCKAQGPIWTIISGDLIWNENADELSVQKKKNKKCRDLGAIIGKIECNASALYGPIKREY